MLIVVAVVIWMPNEPACRSSILPCDEKREVLLAPTGDFLNFNSIPTSNFLNTFYLALSLYNDMHLGWRSP